MLEVVDPVDLSGRRLDVLLLGRQLRSQFLDEEAEVVVVGGQALVRCVLLLALCLSCRDQSVQAVDLLLQELFQVVLGVVLAPVLECLCALVPQLLYR